MMFASLGDKNRVYVVEKEFDWELDARRRGAVDWARQYDTYGDGLTQHSPACGIQKEQLGDFLASLATYLLSDSAIEEDLALVACKWPEVNYHINRKMVIFLGSLRVKEGKEIYYNLEGKVSSSESKRYDKRWHKVPEHADGTIESIYRLTFHRDGEQDYRDTLTRYAIFAHIRNIVAEETDSYGTHPRDWLGIEDRYFYQAFDAVDNLVSSYRYRDGAQRQLDCYCNNSDICKEAKEVAQPEK